MTDLSPWFALPLVAVPLLTAFAARHGRRHRALDVATATVVLVALPLAVASEPAVFAEAAILMSITGVFFAGVLTICAALEALPSLLRAQACRKRRSTVTPGRRRGAGRARTSRSPA